MNIQNTKISKISKRGFTLIELLVVIAILAVLATVSVLVLNPAELIRQGRDSTRISDLATLNSALALYLADVATPSLGTSCVGEAIVNDILTAAGTSPLVGTSIVNALTAVNGTGWVSVNLTTVTGGSPLSKLPMDPLNNTTNFYAYGCDKTALRYEVNANMESGKYQGGATPGSNDVESNSKDGGNNNDWYEVGSDPGLDL